MEGLLLKGEYLLRKRRDDKLLQEAFGDNLIVTAGKHLVRDLLIGSSELSLTHIGVGQGGTAPANTQTALINQEFRKAVTPTGNSIFVTMSTVLSSADGDTSVFMREFGIFTAAVGGTMFSRFVTPAFSLGTDDELDFLWSLTIGAT